MTKSLSSYIYILLEIYISISKKAIDMYELHSMLDSDTCHELKQVGSTGIKCK